MKKWLSFILSLTVILSLTIFTVSAYDYSEALNPGDIISLTKDMFVTDEGIILNEYVPLDTSHFTVYRKSFAKGGNLVKDVRVNGRKEEVEIIMGGNENTVAPNSPNVILSHLSLRCIRSIRASDGTYLAKSGDIYVYQGTLELTVGATPEVVDFDREGTYISLVSNENKFVKFNSTGSSYGDITIDYTSNATGKMRVFDGQRGFLYFDDDVNPSFSKLNPNAYIWAVNLGDKKLPSTMTLYLYADKNDYIYQNTNGSLRLLGQNDMTYDDNLKAWKIQLTTAKNFIISDKALYSTNSSNSNKEPVYSPEDEEYWINKYNKPLDKPNNNGTYVPTPNPSTGGYPTQTNTFKSIVSIAITAISCITVISIATSSLIFAKKDSSKPIIFKRKKK